MILKDHSAQAIFEALMLDPDLEIDEGQTREEAAKHEAEFRSRQHWNNMRALALGTGETDFEKSPIKALADFISRPAWHIGQPRGPRTLSSFWLRGFRGI